MTVDAEPATKVMYDHCVRVYQAMYAEATKDKPTASAHEKMHGGPVYVGHFTKLFSELGLSTPYYTAVKRHLVNMGCIEQLRRGGGSSPSKWILRKEPDEEAFNSFETMKARKTGKSAAQDQQIRDLNERVHNLERDKEAVDKTFQELYGVLVNAGLMGAP